MLTKPHHPWLLVIGIVPLALTLTGCFGGPSVPNLPDGDGTGEVDDELVEDIVEGSNDGLDFEAGSLPADFPVDDIPLVEGELGPSMSIPDSQGWTVTVFVADEATAESATELLEQAGFSNEDQVTWETDEYVVVALPSGPLEDGRWSVYYQVQAQQ